MPKKTAVEQRLDDMKEQLTEGFKRVERALESHAASDKETFDDHCDRLTDLEKGHAGLYGRLAVGGSIAILMLSAVAAAAARYLMP